MIKKRNIFFSIIIAISLLISFYFDKKIVRVISLLRIAQMETLFSRIFSLYFVLVVFLVLTVLFLYRKNKRRWVLPLWLTLSLSIITSFILKVSIQRPRPFQIGLIELPILLKSASHSIWNFSLPSFHSMFIFCVLPLISKEFPKMKYPWIFLAILTSFSRLYFGLHFLSDLIIGGVIGYTLGMIIIDFEKEKQFGKKFYEKIIRKN